MLTSFEKIDDYNKAGNKGKFLSILKHEGFNVPDGFVLDSDTFDEFMSGFMPQIDKLIDNFSDSDISSLSDRICSMIDECSNRTIIEEALHNTLDDNVYYAVRSSSTKEDLGSFSFAGQYDTYLNIRGIKAIVNAVIGCYKSLFSQTVLSYLSDNKLDIHGLKMPVVIQKMVDADYSGVAFTIDPKSGNDKTIYIEAVHGLGDILVSGKARPETYSINWYDDVNHVDKENTLISSTILEKMRDTFLSIQIYFGYPCDIEFAVKDDTLYILQARAITRIGHAGIKDVWTTADFKDGGVSAYVCTPYMWSLYEYIWDYALKRFVLDSKILRPADVDKKIGEMFYGRPYWNLTTVKKAMSSVPGYKEREFDSEYGIKITYDGDGDTTGITIPTLLRIAIIALAQRKILKERLDNADDYKKDLLSRYNFYKETADEQMDFEAFISKWYKLTRDDYLYSESTYFRQIFINTIHQSLYKDSLLKFVSESDYLSLLGGIDNISHLLPFYQMWETSRRIRSDKEAFIYWKDSSINDIINDISLEKYYLPEVSDFLDKFGYHSDRELDVTYPCYCEDLPTVIRMLTDNVLLDDSCSPVEDKAIQRALYEGELAKIESNVGARKYRKIKAKVDKMRNMLWWREEFRDVSTRFYYIIRIYTIRLSNLLVKEGILEDASDIWMLKVSNLWDFFDNKLSRDLLRDMIDKNKKYYNSFRHFTSDNEIGCVFDLESKQTTEKRDGFYGLGCNNGLVTATARVIESLEEYNKLRQGDILVTKYTDTGWTCKFAMLSGIVTEYGGILCHAAIVSREYGIPCIVCANDAMKKIKDGSTITINGTTGEIKVEG